MEKKKLEVMDLIGNETRLGIVLSLMVYNSLNLRKIAKIANIKEPSAYEHVKALLNDNTIELDQERANERGKYYKLTQEANTLLEKIDEIDLKEAKENLVKGLPIIVSGIRTPAIIAKNFAVYLAEYLGSMDPKNPDEAKTIAEMIEELHEAFQIMEVRQKDTIPKLKKALKTFINDLQIINDEESKLEGSELIERYLIYSFCIPLQNIDPNRDA